MKISLFDIKNDIDRYISIISNITKVDVGVVDSNLVRVTGTGLYKNIEGITSLGNVYKNTLETGKTHIIKNPRQHHLCSSCIDSDSCKETLEISTPIFCQNDIVGVLGLVCFSKEQRDKILSMLDSYLIFTKQIAEFIGNKYFEHQENLLQKDRETTLNSIIDSIDKGVIICDKDGKILRYNTVARDKFTISPKNLGENITLISQNDCFMNEEIFKMYIDEKEYQVLGKIIPLTSFDNRVSKAFIFQDLKKLNKNIAKITNDNTINIDNIYGNSKFTFDLKETIVKVANSNSTVLITGESGTGKELVARSLHSHSDRKNKPFVVINCSAIPDALLESELFGYVKGAFTGADSNGRIGKFELANSGVIFLDEIGDMPLYLQAKILRVLQEKKIERIGSNKSIDLDVRIIAATNINLEQHIKERKFRSDLYYRLNVIPIKLLPLRDRKEDILPIVERLLQKYSRLGEKSVFLIDEDVKKALLEYNWYGNVRELENVIELMFNLNENSQILTKKLLPEKLLSKSLFADELEQNDEKNLHFEDFEEIEKKYIIAGLKKYGNTTEGKIKLSEKMNVGLTTLYRKCKKYNIG